MNKKFWTGEMEPKKWIYQEEIVNMKTIIINQWKKHY